MLMPTNLFFAFERTLTHIGHRPALYIPEDLVKSMHLKQGMGARIFPRSPRSLIIEFFDKKARNAAARRG